MILSFRFLRMPRPTHFLGLFDLQNGAELILMSALLNKVSGIYGILAIFTGAEISALQLSMYIYSLLVGGTLIALSPRVHKHDPLAALSFAYLYVADSLINALYTIFFGVSWFLVLSSHSASSPLGSGGATDGNAGLTASAYNASIVTFPASEGQDAVAVGTSVDAGLSAGVLQPESATSILIISVLWIVRSYFVFVVLAFARNVVRDSATPGEAPFSGRNYGDGWKGRLGRTLVGVNSSYWQGAEGWERLGSKFRRSEDERRSMGRRSEDERRSMGSRRSSLPV